MADESRKKAEVIKAKVDAAFQHVEAGSPSHEIGYVDMLRITDMVKHEFDLNPPPKVAKALEEAANLCKPPSSNLGKIAGFMIVFGAALVLAFGIVQAAVVGVKTTPQPAPQSGLGSAWDSVKSVFVATAPPPGPTYNYCGPIAIAIGIVLVLCGIYLIKRSPYRKHAFVDALGVIRRGLDAWAAEETA